METKKSMSNKGKKTGVTLKTKEKQIPGNITDTLTLEELPEFMPEVKPESYYTKMGAVPEKNGCTFTIWAPHAVSVFIKYKFKTGKDQIAELQKTTIPGYGNMCFTTFIDDIKEGTWYRYIIEYNHNTYERIDAWGQSIIYPNWSPTTQDDSDAWSVVVSRDFKWNSNYPVLNWNEMVVYQLHIGTFFNQDPVIPSKITSLTKMISHFKTLGINVIQLLPFTEFASPLSLGYNSMLPYALEADYGTPAEFKEFIQACHDNGILIFLDVIFNHFDINAGDPDPKPYSLADYDGWEASDFPDGIFFYDNKNINTRGGSPRPNYSISGVRHYLVDNIRMWIEEYKIDGFRFDSTKCMRKRQSDNIGGCNGTDIIVNERNHAWELMQTINNLIVEAYPQTFSIAEDLDGNAWITKKCADGGAGFDSQWDSELQTKLTEVLTKPFDDLINLNELVYTLCNPLGGEALHRVIYLETNDTVRNNRTVSLIEPGNPEGWYARKKTMLGMGIIMTSPGIPMIFQGQEFLSWQPWDDQKPINWEQLKRFPKYFRFFCDLIRLRTNENSQTNGLCGENIQIIQCNNQTKVLAYRRWSKTDGSDNIIVVANFSCNIYHSYTIGFPVFGKWHIRLNSDSNSYSDSNDFECTHCYDASASPGNFNNQLYHGDIAIGPYAIIILTQ